MNSQDFASPPPRRPGPGPWRWLVVIVLALLFGLWAAFDLLPRLAGGLLGDGLEIPGGGPGVNWDEVQVVWDPSPPADETGAENTPEAAEEPPAESVIDEMSDDVEPIEPQVEVGSPDPGGGAPDAAGEPGPADEAAAAQAGQGDPEGAGRRSPRILYSEWPSRDLLDDLEMSGRLRYRLRVERDGDVSGWELLQVEGPDFHCPACLAEAERIIRGLRFAPGTLDGKPVACWVPYEISFEMERRDR